jgi:2-oxoglutarate ferredoxin oxidoreductase subunit alpha
VLSDLDLGMNYWISDAFVAPDQPMDRGKVLTAENLTELGAFGRYQDADGDGIPYRTTPGTNHPLAPWFARGTGHDANAVYSERPEDWEANMNRLWRKLETARSLLPPPVVERQEGARIGLIGYGTTDPAIQEARSRMADLGVASDYLRVRGVPFHQDVAGFVRSHERVVVIEMNTDGQMRQLLQLEVPDCAGQIESRAYNSGLPLSARWIVDAILGREGG